MLLWLCGLGAANLIAADFDGDGVADEYKVTREAEKIIKDPRVRVTNPWHIRTSRKQSTKGTALVIRLTRSSQTFLLVDHDYFDTPIWSEAKPPLKLITKNDRSYRDWKKQVPGLRNDAIALPTEAGIEILLYWDGQWQVFWPDEEP